MRAIACTVAVLAALASQAAAQTRINSINTNFRWLGPDDKIIVERYDDPRVRKCVVLYVACRYRRD